MAKTRRDVLKFAGSLAGTCVFPTNTGNGIVFGQGAKQEENLNEQ